MNPIGDIKRNLFPWLLLISLFVFDNSFSYIAITKFSGREANLLIAYWVETYPLLYFLCIPIQIFIINLVVKGFLEILSFLFRKKDKPFRLKSEKSLLWSLIVYWVIGNTSMNLAFLIGHKQSIQTWCVLSGLGIFAAIIVYIILMLSSSRTNKFLKPSH